MGLNELDKTLEKLKSYKETIVTYLSMLYSLKSKINFGKGEYCLQLEFSWKDVLRNDYNTSYNINFEYFSAYFNLAIIYVQMGKLLAKTTDDLKLKEGIKHFQTAAWIFDHIKQEIVVSIPTQETPSDLSSNYLSYVSRYNIFFLVFVYVHGSSPNKAIRHS
jgi:tetratricopeptide (TPR) repeat protein